MNSPIACPRCQRPLNVPDDLLGTRVKCPACAEIFTASEELLPRPHGVPVLSAADDEEDRRDRGRRRDRSDPDDEEPRSRRRRPSVRYDDEDDRPRRRDRYDDEADDDYDRRPSRIRNDKPGKVQAIAVMTLVGGILALVHALGWMATCFGFFWPGTYYSLVLGIMAIIKGVELLGDRARDGPPPMTTAVMQIVNIINLDVINLTMGIINVVFLHDREVDRYFRR
jgi:hypothetical protein